MDRKKSDYMELQKYGEWLEEYLDPALTYRELKNLIFDAAKLIHLDYWPRTTDKLIVALEKKEPDTQIWSDLREPKYTGPLPYTQGIKNLLKEVERISDSDTVGEAYRVLNLMINGREASLVILQNILEVQVPFVDYLDNATKEIFKILSDWSSNIMDITEIGGDTFQRRRTVINGPRKKRGNKERLSRGHGPDVFPLHSIFARVFTDFLVLGGWNYYGFCKHCGKFFLVQRKGRKQFCSDPCRFQFHHPAKNTQR
jgi:hypothetical protein